ncbi:MAG: hypothetical protein DME26_07890 [Verrucomicrobia bacterium]|nr:MAG: hypothetical protein DME26_07890 [Verrucomicrobiota bacterium]
MQAIQSDTVLNDAPVFVPYIAQAFVNAQSSAEPVLAALAANPAVAEAVQRLGRWDFTSPTGIPEGFDAGNVSGLRLAPSNEALAASVAATLYSVWRGQVIRARCAAASAGRIPRSRWCGRFGHQLLQRSGRCFGGGSARHPDLEESCRWPDAAVRRAVFSGLCELRESE